MYALQAGVSAFGQVASRTVGYMASEWLEIRTVVPCDFTNLPHLIVIGHMLLPLVLLPLTVLLLPSSRIDQPIADVSGTGTLPPDAIAAGGNDERRGSVVASSVAYHEDDGDEAGGGGLSVRASQFAGYSRASGAH